MQGFGIWGWSQNKNVDPWSYLQSKGKEQTVVLWWQRRKIGGREERIRELSGMTSHCLNAAVNAHFRVYMPLRHRTVLRLQRIVSSNLNKVHQMKMKPHVKFRASIFSNCDLFWEQCCPFYVPREWRSGGKLGGTGKREASSFNGNVRFLAPTLTILHQLNSLTHLPTTTRAEAGKTRRGKEA